jgi:ABC-type lipoprotein export system ATPase subunit
MVMNMLQEINKLGKTVIMVTHAQKYKQMAGRIIDISEVSRSDRRELKSNKND